MICSRAALLPPCSRPAAALHVSLLRNSDPLPWALCKLLGPESPHTLLKSSLDRGGWYVEPWYLRDFGPKARPGLLGKPCLLLEVPEESVKRAVRADVTLLEFGGLSGQRCPTLNLSALDFKKGIHGSQREAGLHCTATQA